ncbi:MAG: hypothetical protein RIS46_1129, partial [Actinomycetota bacterium]
MDALYHANHHGKGNRMGASV